MGIYIFNTQTLVRRVIEDAKTASKHDFGKHVIPQMVKKNDNVFVYSYRKRGGRFAYWRDIGTIDAYWSANMDLLKTAPQLKLDKKNWTIHTYYRHLPPTQVAAGSQIKNAMLCHGCQVKKSLVEHSILSPNVRVGHGAEIRDSVIMDDVQINAGAKIHKAIIDKRVKVPKGMVIGGNPAEDRKMFTVTRSGIVVAPQDMPL
jgi:glucose-1-phosphate adenylyltransferase